MSARLRATATALVAATLAAGAVAALPATANAATGLPAPAVKLSVAPEYGGAQILFPGLNGGWPVIIKAVNNTDKAQTFRAGFGVEAKGAVNLRAGEVVSNVVALGKTPATGYSTVGAYGVIGTAFFPKGHRFGQFTIPAHTTYLWKGEVAATKAWPMNDNTMKLTAGLAQENPLRGANTAPIYARVGKGNPGGTMNESLAGSTQLNFGGPAFESLTLTNHTGATLNQTWSLRPTVFGTSSFGTDVWVGSAAAGHWQPLPAGASITVPAGLANGASVTFHLRVRLVHFVNTGLSHQSAVLTVANPDGTTNPGVVSKQLTALRSGI